jgi:dynein assembly factor 2
MTEDSEEYQRMFEASQQQKNLEFTEEETEKFKKAFDDPEFRRMFSEYMDEIQDPKNRQETEAYISQLEGDKKVPKGKELIHPEPSFVAKTVKENTDVGTKEKLFLNIVQSNKILKPMKEVCEKGTSWQVPYSLGPPHMEKDKSGNNAPCFDCCFHPDAITLAKSSKQFRDLLVHTGMEGVEQLFARQKQKVKLQREFHVLVGTSYKQGAIPTMMIDISSKKQWNTEQAPIGATGSHPPSDATKELNVFPTGAQGPVSPVIKKGFLNTAKKGIYDDKLTTIRKQVTSKTNHDSIRLNGGSKDNLERSEAQLHQTHGIRSCLVSEVNAIEQGKASSVMGSRPDGMGKSSLTAISTTKKTPAQLHSSLGCMNMESDAVTDTSKMPMYTIKERGTAGLGDFEAMKNNKIPSNRPEELVVTVMLPKVTKVSKLVLDVSDREIRLNYLNIYELAATLPYPVLGNGSAKFDKSSKSLVITFRVKGGPSVSLKPVADKDEHDEACGTEEEKKK